MLLHFWVQGRPSGTSAPDSDSESYVDKAVHWTKETVAHVSEMSVDEMVENVKTRAEAGLDTAKQLFKFLSGDPVARSHSEVPAKPEVKPREEEKGWTSGFTGLFSGLRGTSQSTTEKRSDAADGGAYTEGEVHADLVMVRGDF